MNEKTDNKVVEEFEEDFKEAVETIGKRNNPLPPPYTFALLTSPGVKPGYRTPGVVFSDLFDV